MTGHATTIQTTRRTSILFRIAVLASLALVAFGLAEILFFGILAWFDAATVERFFPSDDIHRIHGLAHSFVAWVMAICIAVQLRNPAAKFAPAVLALGTLAIYAAASLTTGMFDPLEVVGLVTLGAMVWFHPGRTGINGAEYDVRRSLAAAPLLVGAVYVAFIEYGKQLAGAPTDPHVAIGHYATMAVFAVVVASAAVVGSLALPGQAIAASLAVAGAMVIGVGSIVFPDYASSMGLAGGLAAVGASAVFGLAVLTARLSEPGAESWPVESTSRA